jgi:hypothetical protein
MATSRSTSSIDSAVGSFGFNPTECVAHFVVAIPAGTAQPVEISEHFSWHPASGDRVGHYGEEREDGQVRCRLPRPKWNDVADAVRTEFNARLRRTAQKPGRWKTGANVVSRLFGKELTLLAWAIEDADPALTKTAIANWQGLTPEERWWLYTMTAAATGNFQTGRNRGWRKAVRFALTENPVSNRPPDEPVVPEFFQLVSEREQAAKPAVSGGDTPSIAKPRSPRSKAPAAKQVSRKKTP